MMNTLEVFAGLAIIVIAVIVAIPAIKTTIKDGVNMFKELKEMDDDE